MSYAPEPGNIDRVLDPWIVERMSTDDAAWGKRTRALSRKWGFRRMRRRYLGWLPTGLSVPKWLRGRRTQSYIRDMYERAYSTPSSVEDSPHRSPVPAVWNGEGLLVRRGALPRIHLLFIAEAIRALEPKDVLEVGAGDGRNLFALSARFPDVSWSGVELTANGPARVANIKREPSLPASLEAYIPWPIADATAYRRVEARQGNATALPFEDNSFDVVMTHLALEQMETIRDAALSEIARVAKKAVLLLEPFADFQTTPLRRSFIAAKDYFSLPVEGLRDYGIEPTHVTDGFPQNVRTGQGMVVGYVT